jgi:hypothetical protein
MSRGVKPGESTLSAIRYRYIEKGNLGQRATSSTVILITAPTNRAAYS